MTYNLGLVSFVETKLFSRLVVSYLSDEEYRQLQQALIANPSAGAWFVARAACGSCGGVWPAGGNVEVSASSTT